MTQRRVTEHLNLNVKNHDAVIASSLLLQIQNLFQIEFFRQCDVALPLSIYSILLVSLRLSSGCLRLLPRHFVTSILPSVFSSITRLRK